jgi:S-methylmethionine-dependent homocysteine/selenocysteine methylase
VTERWRAKLRAGDVIVLDGGTGTELRRRGIALDASTWSAPATLAHYDQLVRVHADYARAGADVLSTNTFASTRFVLAAAGLDARADALTRAAVTAADAARRAVRHETDIAGVVSCLPPRFDPRAYPAPDVEAADYRELTATLADAGADLLLLEMLEDTEHAPRACAAARESGLAFWLGVSARVAPSGTVVAYDFPDTPLARVLDAVLEFEPALVADVARGWADAGIDLIGGCCGTTPAHIRALADMLAERRESMR